MIAKTKFQMTTSIYVDAFSGAANLTKIAYEPVDQFLDIPVDTNQHLDFDAATCTEVVISLNKTELQIKLSEGDISFNKGWLYVKFGAFGLDSESYTYTVTAFFGTDTTEGVVLSNEARVRFNKK